MKTALLILACCVVAAAIAIPLAGKHSEAARAEVARFEEAEKTCPVFPMNTLDVAPHTEEQRRQFDKTSREYDKRLKAFWACMNAKGFTRDPRVPPPRGG